MDYARRQRDPTRHMLGIAFVVLLHALVIYALVTGLAVFGLVAAGALLWSLLAHALPTIWVRGDSA